MEEILQNYSSEERGIKVRILWSNRSESIIILGHKTLVNRHFESNKRIYADRRGYLNGIQHQKVIFGKIKLKEVRSFKLNLCSFSSTSFEKVREPEDDRKLLNI